MKAMLTEAGIALLKANGKIQAESLKANEKALDEGKWFMSGKSAEGKTRKRSSYVQYLRGYLQALKDVADGKELKPWTPSETKPAAVPANVNIQEIVDRAVKAALKGAGL